MANWPSDVETVNVVWGGGLSPTGNEAATTLTVTLVAPGTDNIHRLNSETVMIPLKDRASTLIGATGVLAVPATDQSGWVDGSGAAYTGWAYRFEIRYGPVTNRSTVVRQYSPVMAEDTVYLESLPEGDPADPVTPGGGSVTLDQVNQQLVIPHINDTTPHPAYDDMPSLVGYFENGLA